MNKHSLLKHTPNELVYDEPLIRLSSHNLEGRGGAEIDLYSFRINQTSRFNMQLGMHYLAH